MTWLSRLRPQSRNDQRLATQKRRARQARRRCRLAILEGLEDRTLLAGDVTVSAVVGNIVTITGDTHNDQFNINEDGGSTITVVGTPLGTTHTSINGLPAGTPVTLTEVTGIEVVLPGATSNVDVVSLTETPQVQSGISSVAITVTGTPALNLTVTGVGNAGTFTLTDGSSTTAGGELSANVTSSRFAALSISQTGYCPASVELDNDTVVGAVSVAEGLANGDGIVLDAAAGQIDHFGSTTLIQGAGASLNNPTCNGDGDFVDVNDAVLKDLTLDQPTGVGANGDTNGVGDSIAVGLVSDVQVALTSFGIVATQGDGDGDTIQIVSVTTSGLPIDNLHGGPDSIVTWQGNGRGDATSVENATVAGNISSTQGNGDGDTIAYLGDTAGWTNPVGPTIQEFYGVATILQGDGYNDTVTMDCGGVENASAGDIFNNSSISQGDSLASLGCSPGVGDVVTVNCTTITSDLTILQGIHGAAIGNNEVNIATTSPVTVGDSTVINEESASSENNTILLGGASGSPDSGSTDFETGYLDVFGGAAGGAYAGVENTLVEYGSLGYFGLYNIEYGGDGNNSLLDDFSSLSVTALWTMLTPTITWANPADITYGTALGATQLDATASVPGRFVYTPAPGTVLSAGADQTLSVTFTPTDTNDYNSVTTTVTLTVQKATPTITWANPADITYGTALGASQLDATASVPGSYAYTPAPGTVLSAGAGQTLSVTFTPADTADYNSVTATTTLNVAQAQLTVTARDQSMTYGSSVPALTDTITGFVNGDDASVITGIPGLSTTASSSSHPGSYPITVDVSGLSAANYWFAAQDGTLTVGMATPVLSWANPADITYGTALGATQLDATASVPGSFVYTPAPGTVLSAGAGQTLSVTFTPGDTTDYQSVTATAAITVQKATPTITWANPADITYGTALGASQLDAAASVPGRFVYTPAPGTVLPAGAGQTLSVTFTPTDTTDYNSVTTTAAINVQKATPAITWANPADITYGTALGATQLDATTIVPGSFAYTPAGGTVLSAGDGQTLSVTFTPSDTNDYNPVTATVTLNVQKAAPMITWANPADITYGTALGTSQLDATASVPGRFVYTPAPGTVLSAGADQTLSVTFTPSDTNDYQSVSATVTLNVEKATPTITWANPAAITYGTALGATQLDAAASVPGSFVYTPAAGTVLSAGADQTLSVTFTPADSNDYNPVTATAAINVSQAQLTVTARDQSMTYGSSVPTLTDTITGFVNGDDASVVAGIPGLSTTASSSSHPGSYPITVDVSGLSAANYWFAAQDGTLTVGMATPVLSWANPADITYGTALGATQLDATASVPGSFAYTPAPGAVLPAGADQTLSVTFTPTDTNDYNSVAASVTLNVQKAIPVLSWANPADITYGTALGATQLDAAASVPGRFVYTPAPGTVLSAGADQTLSVTFMPTDGNDYKSVTATAAINVEKATPTITWSNPANITYGTALGASQLDAIASVPGRFVYTPAAGTVLSAGTNETLSVAFIPTDTTDYGSVTATAMMNVNRAPLLITANSATKVYGQPNPAFTVTYAGLTNGDLPSSLGGSLQFTTPATASSPVNTYGVVPGGLTSPNYAIKFAVGELVVTPAPLTITARNQSRAYGQPNPPLTAYYQGFVNGDTPASLSAPVILSTPAVRASFAGSYPIFVGGAESPNYAIRFVGGTLTILPPSQPVVLGRIAFVSSLYHDLLLTSPGPEGLFSWLQQLDAGLSTYSVASAINRSHARRAVLRSHHGDGFDFAVALRRARKAQHHAIEVARRALEKRHP